MSDEYAIRRYHRQTTVVGTTGRKKKYLILFLLFLVVGSAGVAYAAWSSGVFAESNPKIAPLLATRINQERHAANIAPVQLDPSLSSLAYTKSQEVKISSLNYAQGVNPNPDPSTSVLIVPKISWALSNNDFQQVVTDSTDPANAAFRLKLLNPEFRAVGIGVTSDSYNYYIVTKWKAE
jgi:hypothetical protein